MSEHCPQDGGFIGDAGCTHPNHQHSELVKSLIVGTEPRGHLHDITPNEAEAALREGFYVDGSNGKRIGFGKRLLDHIDGDVSHSEKDKSVRKSKLMYAVSTVRHPDRVEPNHRDYPGRTLYAKASMTSACSPCPTLRPGTSRASSRSSRGEEAANVKNGLRRPAEADRRTAANYTTPNF